MALVSTQYVIISPARFGLMRAVMKVRVVQQKQAAFTRVSSAFVNCQILHSGTLPGTPPPVSCCLSRVMSAVPDQAVAVEIDDDRKLEELGYVPSFKREFSNLATVRCRFSRAFPHLHLTKPVHRLALRSASWYFLRPEPKKFGRSPGRVLGCLLRCIDVVQYALVTWGSILGLSGYVMAVIATHVHAIIRFPPIEQVTWCWLLGATMCFTLGTFLPLLHTRLETNALASHRLEHSRNRQRSRPVVASTPRLPNSARENTAR